MNKRDLKEVYKIFTIWRDQYIVTNGELKWFNPHTSRYDRSKWYDDLIRKYLI